ncbi:MAG: tryptophan-rich sensory protein [Clostridia bacterium]|nr:tryptophan-rich sensory protein [Clostridia bacterium]
MKNSFFDKILSKVRIDLSQLGITYPIVFAVLSVLIAVLSAFVCKTNAFFFWCKRPPFCLPFLILLLIINVMFIAFGISVGCIAAIKERYFLIDKYKALLVATIAYVFMFSWAPIFFLTYNIFISAIISAIISALLLIFLLLSKKICFTAFIFSLISLIIGIYLCYLNFAFFIVS